MRSRSSTEAHLFHRAGHRRHRGLPDRRRGEWMLSMKLLARGDWHMGIVEPRCRSVSRRGAHRRAASLARGSGRALRRTPRRWRLFDLRLAWRMRVATRDGRQSRGPGSERPARLAAMSVCRADRDMLGRSVSDAGACHRMTGETTRQQRRSSRKREHRYMHRGRWVHGGRAFVNPRMANRHSDSAAQPLHRPPPRKNAKASSRYTSRAPWPVLCSASLTGQPALSRARARARASGATRSKLP